MPLEKIAEPNLQAICISPEHNPPMFIVLQPGEYKYTCPACGKEVVFTVPQVLF